MRFSETISFLSLGRLRPTWRFSLRLVFLMVVVVAVAMSFYQPPRTVTTAFTLPTAPVGASNQEAQIYAQTQAALLQSPFVIKTAMQRNDVRELAVVRRQEHPAKWIESQLNVALPEQPGSGTAQVTLTTRDGDVAELKLIVDAILEAYQREIAVE